MSFITDSMILGGKAETVQGVAEVLVAADFATTPHNDVSITTENQETARQVANGKHGSVSSVMGTQMATGSFVLDLIGSGAAGTAPNLGEFFKASGMLEALVASTSVTYTADITKDCDSMTIERREFNCIPATDVQSREVVFGAMGNFNLSASAIGEPLIASFEFKGKYAQEDDTTTIIEVTGVDTAKPEAFIGATASVFGQTLRPLSFELDFGNDIQPVMDAGDTTGISHFMINTRDTILTMPIIREPTAVFDTYGNIGLQTTGALVLSWGTPPNLYTISATVQLVAAPSEEENGSMTQALTIKIIDDSLSIAIT